MVVTNTDLRTSASQSAAGNVPRLLLDRPALAHAVGLSQRTIANLIKLDDDPLPCVRFGRAVRFDPRDVQDWINRRKGNQLRSKI